MKAPVVIVAVTLTVGILVVASFLIATGAHGEDAVRLACANLSVPTLQPASLAATDPIRFKEAESDRPIVRHAAGNLSAAETFLQARIVTLVAEREQACSSTGAPSPVRS
ncbi:MAG: hypothetical protein ACREC2_16210 [Bradyrhizobium sp.]|jgi:hypothetical protein